jgi:hypothetical protein
MPPPFFHIKNYFTKMPSILFAKTACLILFFSTQNYDIILCCSNYLIATDTTITFHDKWIIDIMPESCHISGYIQYNLVKPPPSAQPDLGVITSLAIN